MSDPRAEPSEPLPDDVVVEGELLDVSSDESVDAALDEEVTFETLLTDLERLTTEREEYLDAYRRTQADFENFKKAMQRRQEDHVLRMVGGLVERLLPVLDACDSALQHGASEVEPIAAALLGALEKEGLVRIDPIGESFDPHVADAVVHEPGDGGDHIVSEVLRAGYSWQGRVLRPAMVKVTD